MIAQTGSRDQDQQPADDDVERALHRPVEADEDGRAQLEERHALAGDVLRALPQQLRGRRRDPHLHARAVRLLDEVEQLVLAEVDAADDQLVQGVLLEHAREIRDAAEHRQAGRGAVGREDADELVVDAAAAEPERAAQRDEPLAVADEHRAPPRARDPPDVRRDHLVAGAEQRDHDRADHERGHVEPERRVLVAGAERERERDHHDEQQRRDDPPGAPALLPRGVQPRAPEDEHRHEREERQPVLLRVPGQPPEDRPLAVVELPQDEREVERAGEPGQVDDDERDDADRAAGLGAELSAGGKDPGRPDVGGVLGTARRGSVTFAGAVHVRAAAADYRLGRHESGNCTPLPSGSCGRWRYAGPSCGHAPPLSSSSSRRRSRAWLRCCTRAARSSRTTWTRAIRSRGRTSPPGRTASSRATRRRTPSRCTGGSSSRSTGSSAATGSSSGWRRSSSPSARR